MNTKSRSEDRAAQSQNIFQPTDESDAVSDSFTGPRESATSRGSIRFLLEPEDWETQVTRPMKKGRFLLGFLLAGGGIGLMLTVAVGALQTMGLDGGLSLPSVGLFMLAGLMLLGGGFGIMATSAARFDDGDLPAESETCSEVPKPPPLNAEVSSQRNTSDSNIVADRIPLTRPSGSEPVASARRCLMLCL